MRFTSGAHNILNGGGGNGNNSINTNNYTVATTNANNIIFTGMRINRQVGNVKAGHFFNNNNNTNNNLNSVDQVDGWRQVHNNQSIGNPGMFNFDFSGTSDNEMIPAQCGVNNHTALPSLRDDTRVPVKANNLISRRIAQRYQ